MIQWVIMIERNVHSFIVIKSTFFTLALNVIIFQMRVPLEVRPRRGPDDTPSRRKQNTAIKN